MEKITFPSFFAGFFVDPSLWKLQNSVHQWVPFDTCLCGIANFTQG